MNKSPGAICEQFVRCGKSGCRCSLGEPHGPYHYLFYRDDSGRLRKRYIRRASVGTERAQLANEKALIAAQNEFLDSFNPPKRKRRYDLFTSVMQSVTALERLMDGSIQQPRDKAGKFRKAL